jgi:hypothetical protein
MMRTVIALLLAIMLFLLISVVGCGDSSGPGTATMVASGGNLQSGQAFNQAPQPLRVLVIGQDGAPFPGASVTWQVTTGGGSVNPATAVTDGTGQASTTVTFAAPGAVSVQARAGGLTVTFQLTSVAACEYLAPFGVDTTASGSLAVTDCAQRFPEPVGPVYSDFYGFTVGPQPRVVSLTMQSTAVDTYLELWSRAGELPIIAFDNDGGGGLNSTDSRIKAVLGAGSFIIVVSSWDSTTQFGPYTFSAATSTGVTNCEAVWLGGNVVFTETVAATDCPVTTALGTYYSDQFYVFLTQGQSVTFLQSSTEFDAYLTLFRLDASGATVVAENDNGAGLTDAQITHIETAQFNIYGLDVGTAAAGQTGAYTLSMSPITGAPPVGTLGFAPRAGVRLGRLPARLSVPERRP